MAFGRLPLCACKINWVAVNFIAQFRRNLFLLLPIDFIECILTHSDSILCHFQLISLRFTSHLHPQFLHSTESFIRCQAREAMIRVRKLVRNVHVHWMRIHQITKLSISYSNTEETGTEQEGEKSARTTRLGEEHLISTQSVHTAATNHFRIISFISHFTCLHVMAHGEWGMGMMNLNTSFLMPVATRWIMNEYAITDKQFWTVFKSSIKWRERESEKKKSHSHTVCVAFRIGISIFIRCAPHTNGPFIWIWNSNEFERYIHTALSSSYSGVWQISSLHTDAR